MTKSTVRFINFLFDTGIYFLFLIGLLLLLKNTIDKEDVKWVSMVVYFFYYFLFEYFKGQTIGKIITKSKVISKTGNSDYYFIQIFSRTIMRFIPIDILSYFVSANGLHDWISKTEVVKLQYLTDVIIN